MKVLFCSSECAPLVKLGGLGDVSAALPRALKKLGVDVRVALPLYDTIDRHKYALEKKLEFTVSYDESDKPVSVYETFLPESEVLVLLFENEEYLSGGGEEAFTGLEGELRRFGFFGRAVVEWLTVQSCWKPDLLHLNDWHTGLIPQLIKDLPIPPATLLTIHNLSYQGIASLDLFSEVGLSITGSKVLSWDAADENVDFLLQGIAGADIITTVSPTYAQEIVTAEFGEGLNKVLQARAARIFGVLNGIDARSFDPETDEHIFKNYTASSWREGKRENKRGLQEKLGLPPEPETPLLAFIGRLEPKQKGLELIEGAWGKLKKEGLQFVILGTGDPEWEKKFALLAKKHPKKFAAEIQFDTALARQILAGADILLIPSKFEPCGLLQMMAMRYGAVPLVRRVGGLADSVTEENGFLFEKYEAKGLVREVKRALGVFSRPEEFAALVEKGMKADFSWGVSAQKYLELYRKALGYRFGVASPRVGEYRQDAISGEWVIVAGERKKRLGGIGLSEAAGKFTGCPFDEGNEQHTPPEVLRIGRGAPNGPGWEVRVIPNKFPILAGHEVIIHSPDHEKDIAELPLSQVEKIVQAYVFRSRHYDDKGLPYIYNNRGPESGASLTHPHSQLIIFEKIPEALAEELAGAEQYYQQHQNCSYCDLLRREAGGARAVFENEGFLVISPYAAQWPLELLMIPKKHRSNFSDIDENEITTLAEALQRITAVFREGYDDPSYNFWISSLSRKFAAGDSPVFYHWHLEFVPRLKKLGGVELGAQVMIYDRETPEQAAANLRELLRK